MRINVHAHGGHAERDDKSKLIPPLKKMIDFYERFYEALRVPAEIREKINRKNALMLIPGA